MLIIVVVVDDDCMVHLHFSIAGKFLSHRIRIISCMCLYMHKRKYYIYICTLLYIHEIFLVGISIFEVCKKYMLEL